MEGIFDNPFGQQGPICIVCTLSDCNRYGNWNNYRHWNVLRHMLPVRPRPAIAYTLCRNCYITAPACLHALLFALLFTAVRPAVRCFQDGSRSFSSRFIVNRKSSKKQIKWATEKAFSVKVTDVKTLIDRKGRKKAWIQLAKEYPATDIATRLGML